MRKKISALLAAVLLVLCFAQSAGAINVIMNSSLVQFPDQEPVIENGVTLVPIRPIAEALGLDVTWDEPSQLVTLKKDSFYIELTIGSSVAQTSNGEKQLAAAPKIIGGRTMLPLRFIAETLGLKVLWNDEYKRVVINGKIDTYVKPALSEEAQNGEDETTSQDSSSETQQIEEEETSVSDEGAFVTVSLPSSSIMFELPDGFAYDDTESENSFAYRAIDATDVQHLYDWDSVSLYESYADSSLNNGILVIVREAEPSETEVDISCLTQEYPQAPEKTVDYFDVIQAVGTAMLEEMCAERGVEPEDFLTEDAYVWINYPPVMREILGFETEEEYSEYAEDFAQRFDQESVPEYAEYQDYEMKYIEYRTAYYNLKSQRAAAMERYGELCNEASDEAWAALFAEQLNGDREVRYEGIEILTINDKKIVHGTIYAEDSDDEQGTFDLYLYYDGNSRVTIYGGTLYATEPCAEAVDVLGRMNIQ